jgi:hypothetical protein
MSQTPGEESVLSLASHRLHPPRFEESVTMTPTPFGSGPKPPPRSVLRVVPAGPQQMSRDEQLAYVKRLWRRRGITGKQLSKAKANLQALLEGSPASSP